MAFIDKNYQINELVYESREIVIYRGERVSDRQAVAIKLIRSNYLNFNEVLLLQNQFNIMKSIDLRGILKVISFKSYKNDFVLILEDFGESTLTDYFTKLDPSELTAESLDILLRDFFPIAIQIAEILGELYTHGIIHRDIKPANIQIDSSTGQVKLNNFGHALKSAGEARIPLSQNFEGTLAYASPEQTGRINRGIDYRSDFYSVGVTFYELLTGKLPFTVADPIELIHCHLAKLPIPVSNINPLIPPILSALVAKLMAKNAENRYQSALGLKRDLEYSWSQWQAVGNIETFELGKRSLSDRFTIPGKLYGREVIIQMIVNACARVAQGNAELVLLSGFFGVGKTTILNEVYKLICRQKIYFITGEFIGGTAISPRTDCHLRQQSRNAAEEVNVTERDDRSQQNIPFGAFIQAFRNLMGQLSIEDDARLAKYQASILEVVGDCGQLLIDQIPELEQIIGKQSPERSWDESEDPDRFNRLFCKFVKIFNTLDRPLIICLDNVQWIDVDSLQLLEVLMQDAGQLLIICAYRDNELSGIHPLMLTVNQLRQMGVAVDNIILSPLNETHIHELVADSFNCHVDVVRPLAELVHQKTNGNPFFAIKFLKSLERDGLVKFNPQQESWQCDLSQIKIQSLTNDEIDLMAIQLQQLPLLTQEILKLAACLGMQFDLQTLAIITERSVQDIATILWTALQEGAIVPLQETYNFGQLAQIDRLVATAYRFSHDRVQQAAYSLIPEAERATVCYRLGELLLDNLLAETVSQLETLDQGVDPRERGLVDRDPIAIAASSHARLLMTVDLLNYGVELESHRSLLLQLNPIACRRASASKDDRAALRYAQIALQLLGSAAWHQEYETALDTYKLAIAVAARSGEFELMERWIDETIAHTNSPLESVDVYIVQIQSLVTRDRAVAAIEIAYSVLTQLDVRLPAAPTLPDVQRAMQEIDDLIGDRSIAALADLPPMTDPQPQAMMQVAASIMGACYVTNPLLYALVVVLQVKLSLRYGNSASSAYSYAAYGIVIHNYRQDVASVDRFSSLATKLAALPNADNIRSETLAAIGLFLHHRNAHLQETLPIFQAGCQAGLATGKSEYVGYHIEGLCATAYWCGQNLSELEPQIRAYHQQLLDLDRLTTANYCEIYWETVLVLLGNPAEIDLAFDAPPESLLDCQDLERVFLFYFHRAMLRFLAGDIVAADADVRRARADISGIAGLIYEAGFYFYDSLIALAAGSDLASCQARVDGNQHQLAHWAKYAPMNHLHKWQLVAAETQRVLGDKAAAIEFYDLAIAGAVANDYIQEAALANELAAKFYLSWGKDKIAADYLQTAYDDYNQWGATAKLDDLTSRYPQLLAIRPIALQPPDETLAIAPSSVKSGELGRLDLPDPATPTGASAPHYSILDLNAHIKAIQALYSEIDLDRLLRTLMDVVVENAGADKAALLLNHDGDLTIAIEYEDGELDTLDFDLHSFDRDYRLPLCLIRHVHRTQETEIHNGNNNPYLASDPYFEEHQPQSILCVPILNQSKLIGILYLENSLICGAFTHDRVELLNIICTQAAISLENARLHQESQAYAQRLEQSLLDLQSSQARLHKVADNIPGAIAQICIYPDRDSEVLRYISSGCYELYEVTAAEMIAHGYSLRYFEHPADRPQIDRAIQQSRQHLTPIKLEYRIVTASGQEKWIYLTASSLEPQSDGSWLTECTILDISDRKQAEIKLQVTNEELIRSNRLKDQFLANMSHELRTPLNAILGMTEGLQEQVFGTINQAQLTALNTVERSSTHLLELINDILELAKIEAGQLEIHCAPTDLAALCQSSLVFIKQQAFQKQLQIDVKIQSNLPKVIVDERRMRQVLINLLSNAVKFTSVGGQIGLEVAYLDTPDLERDLTDSAEVEDPECQSSLAPLLPVTGLEHRVRITVTDTGIGISPDNMKRLFQPFIQIDGALNRQFEGTGLGLALVKRIVDLHGGKVGLSSELGLGSSFTIDLPCDDLPTIATTSVNESSAKIAPIPERIAELNSNRSPLILLVEDNEANINTMSSYLTAKGYQIVLARSGREAIDRTKSISPDVILMDIQMPIMDGLTATRQIREFSDIPIIALTALATSDDRDRCLEAGVNEYFSKPVKLKQLTANIQQYLTDRN